MRFFVPSSGKFTKDIPDNQVKGFLSHYPDAIPAEEGMTPNPSAAPAIAPAAKALQETQAAAPASEPEGSWLDALATGAGRGLTADFLDELRGAAAAAGGQIGGRLAGVAPEFLAQENFYEQGRNEERARQKKLEEESPWLTAGGAMAGATVPFLLSGGTAAAPAGGAFLARFGQGAAASYPRLAPVAERFLTAAQALRVTALLLALGAARTPQSAETLPKQERERLSRLFSVLALRVRVVLLGLRIRHVAILSLAPLHGLERKQTKPV